MLATIEIRLPGWLEALALTYKPVTSVEQRMAFVIAAAMSNIEHATGGPFAAGIFEIDSGRLVGLGVNLVTTENLSILHAEMVAFAVAQRTLGTYDLGGPGLARHELVTSAEPCAMCFGAVPWSGVRRVVCGARSQDAERIGFDEGPKSRAWKAELRHRGIAVLRDICRDQAVQVFDEYARRGGQIYNSRGNPDLRKHLI